MAMKGAKIVGFFGHTETINTQTCTLELLFFSPKIKKILKEYLNVPLLIVLAMEGGNRRLIFRMLCNSRRNKKLAIKNF